MRKTKDIRMTRSSTPVAKVVPPLSVAKPGEWMGSLADRMEIVGDILSPVIEEAIWQTGEAGLTGPNPSERKSAKARPGLPRR